MRPRRGRAGPALAGPAPVGPKGGVVGQAGGEHRQLVVVLVEAGGGRLGRAGGHHVVDELVHGLGREPVRVVGTGDRPGVGVEQGQRGHPLGVGGGQGHGDERPGRRPEDGGGGRAHRVEHGQGVAHPVLERGLLAVRRAGRTCPMPDRSKRMRRLNEASRRSKRAQCGSSSRMSIETVAPYVMTRRSSFPSLSTW